MFSDVAPLRHGKLIYLLFYIVLMPYFTDQADMMLTILRWLVRMPTTMGTDPRLPVLDLGGYVDDLFMRHGYGAMDILLILQAHVHTQNVESFTHRIGLLLGWSMRDAIRLWDNMNLSE